MAKVKEIIIDNKEEANIIKNAAIAIMNRLQLI